MNDILEKKLYATKEISPGDDVAKRLNDINFDKNYLPPNYLVGMPDFKRAIKLNKNHIYRVNSPGWLFRSANGELGGNEDSGVIIQRSATDVDIYTCGYRAVTSKPSSTPGGGGFISNVDYHYARKDLKIAQKTTVIATGEIALVHPKKFKKDFTQSHRHVYVSYGSSQCCQIVPILPINGTSRATKTVLTGIKAYDEKDKGAGGGTSSTSDSTETYGMFIMHCAEKDDNQSGCLIFVPAMCASSDTFNGNKYITHIRESLSECNLDMFSDEGGESGKGYKLTYPGTEGNECGLEPMAGKYVSVSFLYVNSDLPEGMWGVLICTPTSNAPAADSGWTIGNGAPHPTDDGNGKNCIFYGHGNDNPFNSYWSDIFSGNDASITGDTPQDFWMFQVNEASHIGYTISGGNKLPGNDGSWPSKWKIDLGRPFVDGVPVAGQLKPDVEMNAYLELGNSTLIRKTV